MKKKFSMSSLFLLLLSGLLLGVQTAFAGVVPPLSGGVLKSMLESQNALKVRFDNTLSDYIREEVSDDVYSEIVESSYDPDSLPWKKISKVAGYPNENLLKVSYTLGKNAGLPWNYVAAVAMGELEDGDDYQQLVSVVVANLSQACPEDLFCDLEPQWYREILSNKAADIEAAYVKVLTDTPADIRISLPIKTTLLGISQPFGVYSYTSEFLALGLAGEFHMATDLSRYGGMEFDLVAVDDGIIISKDQDPLYGSQIILGLSNGCEARYVHTDWESLGETGQKVISGSNLGAVAPYGQCGKLCTGTHLHLVLICDGKPVDPELYFDTSVPYW